MAYGMIEGAPSGPWCLLLSLILILVLFFPYRLSASQISGKTEEHSECVILLHGLGRTSDSMEALAEALETAGFQSVNMDYPSQEKTIEELSNTHLPHCLKQCREYGATTIHFVTHSMGGIIVRYFLAHESLEGLGRVVMLSPPNQGSEAADYLRDWNVYRWYNGPAGQQLGTGPDSLPLSLGPVDFELGIITGNTHAFFDGWLADKIPGPDDGKVSVQRAQVDGMDDFLVLPYTHPFIMQEDEVLRQVIHFLQNGSFSR